MSNGDPIRRPPPQNSDDAAFDAALKQTGGGWSKEDDAAFDRALQTTQGQPPARKANETLGERTKRVFHETFSPEQFQTATRHILNTAAGLPGVKPYEAFMGSLGSKFTDDPMTYRQAYNTLEEETQKIPAPVRALEQMAGAAILTPTAALSRAVAPAARFLAPAVSKLPGVLPKVAGYLGKTSLPSAVGGAFDALVQGDPNKSLSDRLHDAKVSAEIGSVAGPVFRGAGNLAKTGFDVLRHSAPGYLGRVATKMNVARSGAAEKAFTEALDAARARLKQPNYRPPGELVELLGDKDFAPIVERIAERRSFSNVKPTDPRFLDEIVKHLSDVGKMAGRTVEGGAGKVNTARATAMDVDEMKAALLNAMERPGTVTAKFETAAAPKPTMREALDQFDRMKGVAVTRKEGTIDQQRAREALEHRSAQREITRQRPLSENVFGIGGGQTHVVNDAEPFLPGYRGAHDAFAKAMGEKRALKKGLEFQRVGTKSGVDQLKDLDESSIAGAREWAKAASETEKQRALQGVLGSALKASGSEALSLRGGVGGFGLSALGGPGFLVPLLLGASPAARTHVLREMLDPMSDLATMRLVNAAIAASRTAQGRK